MNAFEANHCSLFFFFFFLFLVCFYFFYIRRLLCRLMYIKVKNFSLTSRLRPECPTIIYLLVDGKLDEEAFLLYERFIYFFFFIYIFAFTCGFIYVRQIYVYTICWHHSAFLSPHLFPNVLEIFLPLFRYIPKTQFSSVDTRLNGNYFLKSWFFFFLFFGQGNLVWLSYA